MQRQTFIDNMKERGYSISATINGNIKATKEDITDAETLLIIDILTAQP